MFFPIRIFLEVEDRAFTLFWIDRWIYGLRVDDLAPQDFALVPKRRANKRTMKDALNNHSWIYDIQRAITVGVIADFLDLWDILLEVVLQCTYTSHILFICFIAC